MIFAVIDVGSNTIRFNVFNMIDGEPISMLSKKNVAGLVTYIENSTLSNKGIKKLITILSNQINTIKYFNPNEIFIFATASLRNILNLDDVLKKVHKECKVMIDIISQEDEALLGLSGIKYSMKCKSGTTIDIGGGSTEIVNFNNDMIKFMNLKEGCLSLYSKYVDTVLPTKTELTKIDLVIKNKLKKYESNRINSLIGIGGTVRAIGNILSELIPLNSNKEFSFTDLDFFYTSMLTHSSKTIKTVLQVVPERIHTITTGALILKNVMKMFHSENIYVCNTGLREGFLLNKIGKCKNNIDLSYIKKTYNKTIP